MKRSETVDWLIVVLGPLGFLVLAVPLFAALGHVSTRPAAPDASASWREPVRDAQRALAERRLGDAVRAANTAHAAALGSREWSGLLAVGDLHLRIGEAAGAREAAKARAREGYLIALTRARRDGSLDGVMRVAEAFAALGDPEVVEQALHAAARLADRASPEAQAVYRQTAERLRTGARAVRQRGPE